MKETLLTHTSNICDYILLGYDPQEWINYLHKLRDMNNKGSLKPKWFGLNLKNISIIKEEEDDR